MSSTASAGRKGPGVRSDCWVQIEPRDSGGLEIRLKSKVASMYGESINRLAAETLSGLGVEHAAMDLVDAGAVPFVIMARIEAAVRRAGLYEGAGVMPEMDPCCTYGTSRERFRRFRFQMIQAQQFLRTQCRCIRLQSDDPRAQRGILRHLALHRRRKH